MVSTGADDSDRLGMLIIVSGATAAGKTTVGREIAKLSAKAIHIDGDAIQNMIVTGSITMEVPPPPGAVQQLRRRFRAALMVADLYREAGFDAIISDNLFEDEVVRFLAEAVRSPGRVGFVMLDPSVYDIRARYDHRPGGGYTEQLTPELLKAVVERTPRLGLWLDTASQTAADTAAHVVAHLDDATVDAGVVRRALTLEP